MRVNTRVSALSAIGAMLAEGKVQEQQQAASPFSLRLLGEPGLKVPAIVVETLDEIEPGLVDALSRIMWDHDGLGMAAQQVGGRQRAAVVRFGFDWRKHPGVVQVLINPRILERSEDWRHVNESCLSVPGFQTTVARSRWVVVEYENEQFDTVRVKVKDLDAQIVQHELDHLNGVCIADKVSRQQRRQAERLVEKARAVRP
jgi:peptide deformylase